MRQQKGTSNWRENEIIDKRSWWVKISNYFYVHSFLALLKTKVINTVKNKKILRGANILTLP